MCLVGSVILLVPYCVGQFRGLPSLLFSEYCSNWCESQENVDPYIHSAIRLHGIVHRQNVMFLPMY
jgi:hypothetical protein